MVLNFFDASLIIFLQSFSTHLLDLFFIFATNLGNPFFWIVVSALLFWKGEEKLSFHLMNTIIFVSLIVGAMKIFFKFDRPDLIYQKPQTIFDQTFDLPSDKFSFPSGHAAIISGAFGFFYKTAKKNIQALFLLAVFLVMLSRVYLGRHFLIDVLAGALIGFVVALIAGRFNEWFDRFSKINPKAGRELGIVVIAMLFLFVLFLFEKLALITLPLGYYLGLFVLKETGFELKKVTGQKLVLKAILGVFGLGLFLAGVFLTNVGIALQAALLFFAGIWITLVFPVLFEILSLKKKTKH